jgi:hypothetical protein
MVRFFFFNGTLRWIAPTRIVKTEPRKVAQVLEPLAQVRGRDIDDFRCKEADSLPCEAAID